MSGKKCKAAIDCNGELLEMTQWAPMLIIQGLIDDPVAIDEFNDLKEEAAKQYKRWKKRFVNFDED